MRNSLSLLLLLFSTISSFGAGAQAVAAGSWEPRNYATRFGLVADYDFGDTNSLTLNGAGIASLGARQA
jgi:hypothetical protein